jgi:ATP-dependent DNA helicase RecG
LTCHGQGERSAAHRRARGGRRRRAGLRRGSAEARAGKTIPLDEFRVLLNADDLTSLDEAVTAARLGKLIPWTALQRTLHQPFDHRTAFAATTSDLRISLVREFLHDIGSALSQEPDPERIYAAMQLTHHQNGLTLPRNIGLLFFSDDPQQWFPAARIQLTEFADPTGEDAIQETAFHGPLLHQLRRCLAWLEAMATRHLCKQTDVPEAKSWVNYPLPALSEALVNALYHRSYEAHVIEPTKIHVYPNRVELISYPGPVDGVERAHLIGEKPLPPVQARNRRIGELLKELKLAEGRGTGLPKIHRAMERNGSPKPAFDSDEERTFFRATLPAHA